MATKQQKIAALWKACFNDTDDFIRFYFDKKYRDENALLYEENSEALAALQMLPYPMTWAGTTLNASYISGACTLDKARNRGIMTRLLGEAFRQMRQKGIDISFLIPAEPWLYGYYGKTGYSPVFTYSVETLPASGTSPATRHKCHSPEAYSEELITAYYPYFAAKMAARPCCIQHPEDDFAALLQDLYASGGRLLAVRNPETGKPAGIALALPTPKEIYIPEILSDTEAVRQSLLQYAGELWPGKDVTCKKPFTEGQPAQGGMARIINAPALLARYAAHNGGQAFTLRLTDSRIPENDGFYTISGGKCVKTQNTTEKADLTMNIAGLTEALFCGSPESARFPQQHPFMSLMFD